MTTTEWTAGPIPSPFRRDQDIQEQQGPEESLDRDVKRPAILVDDIVEPEHELPAAVEDDTTPERSLWEEWSPTEDMQGRSVDEEERDPGFEGLTYVEPEYAQLEYQSPDYTEPEDTEPEFEGPTETARPDLVSEVRFEEDTELDPVILEEDWDEFELEASPSGREFTELVERQAPAAGRRCYTITEPTVVPSIGFELDVGYGASVVRPPEDPTGRSAAWESSIAALEGENITNHRIATNGFRIEGDGNRIEIATKPFPLTDAGRAEMRSVMRSILGFVDDMARACARTRPDRTLGFSASAGSPRHFVLPSLEPRAACVFPLRLDPRKAYFRDGCTVAASPQATFTLPLARIDDLVTAIRRSERDRVAGLALSGPPSDRLGDRSIALYDAQRAVAADRARHLRAGTVVPGVGPVTASAYSKNLQGLLILMVSYLRVGELTYGPKDWEIFAKAYLPLNVKNPFRLLFADLSDTEKRTFRTLYDSPAPAGRTALWQLARPGADSAAGGTPLFPVKVQGHQRGWFNPPPTWDDLVQNTVTNRPLIRTESGPRKKGEDVGCEVLYAPLSRLLPYEAGSLRVTVEMRRLGFNWVFAHANGDRPGWATMTSRLFDLARKLNT